MLPAYNPSLFLLKNINFGQVNDFVSESCRNLFERLLFRLTGCLPTCQRKETASDSSNKTKKNLREVEVPDNEEEERAPNEHIVVVLTYVCQRRRAGLRNCPRMEGET